MNAFKLLTWIRRQVLTPDTKREVITFDIERIEFLKIKSKFYTSTRAKGWKLFVFVRIKHFDGPFLAEDVFSPASNNRRWLHQRREGHWIPRRNGCPRLKSENEDGRTHVSRITKIRQNITKICSAKGLFLAWSIRERETAATWSVSTTRTASRFMSDMSKISGLSQAPRS